MTHKNLIGTASLIGAAVIWGGSVVAQKFALQTWNPYFVLFIRGSGTLLFILPFMWIKDPFHLQTIWNNKLNLLGVSMTGFANSFFVLLGLQYTSAMEAGMIMGSTPIVTALMLAILGKQSLDRVGWIGCLLTFFGVTLVVFHPPTETRLAIVWQGDLLVFLGVVSWSIYTLVSKEAMRHHSPFLIMTMTWIGVIFVIPLAFSHYPDTDQSTLIRGWGALIYIVIIATVFGFFLWLYGLHRIGAAHSTVYLNFIPISAILFSALLLGENIYWRQWIGGGFVLIGAWIVSRSSSV
jgi:drug/metabolite transporter (DMT)-like permease